MMPPCRPAPEHAPLLFLRRHGWRRMRRLACSSSESSHFCPASGCGCKQVKINNEHCTSTPSAKSRRIQHHRLRSKKPGGSVFACPRGLHPASTTATRSAPSRQSLNELPPMKPSLLSPEDYRKNLRNHNILGCVVRQRSIFYFLAAEDYTKGEFFKIHNSAPDDDDIPRRVVSFMRQKADGQQWSHSGLQGFYGLVGAAAFTPKEQLVVSCLDGAVFAIGSGESGIEQDIPRRGGIAKAKTIGTSVFVAGGGRTVAKRVDKSQWINLTKSLSPGKRSDSFGFRDVDGFAEDHLYAAGGDGDVWRFEEGKWSACAFPSNMALFSVCTSPTGKVYVSGLMGATFVGLRDSWRLLAEPGLSIPFKDMVWYEDRVWGTNDYGVWWIKDDKLMLADLPGSVRLCAGYLSARDGVLLLAGHGGAAFLENGQWTVIYHPGEMESAKI